MVRVGRVLAALLVLACALRGPSASAVEPRVSGNDAAASLAARSLLLSVARAGDRLVAVGTRGNILVSDDNGANWRLVKSPAAVLLTKVTFEDAKTGYIVGYDATIMKTTDGGDSWTLLHRVTEGDQALFSIAFDTPEHGLAVGAYNLQYVTKDGGQSWSRQSIANLDTDFHLNGIISTGAGSFVIAGEAGNAFVSEDAGQSWQTRSPDYAGSFFGTVELPDKSVVIFGLRGHAFRSGDAGRSWTQLVTGTNSGLLGAAVLSDGRLVLAGNDGALLLSNRDYTNFATVPNDARASNSSVIEAANGKLILVGQDGISVVPVPPANTALAR